MSTTPLPPVRAYLLHVTHYDPRWVKRKSREKSMDVDLALEVVDYLAEAGMNCLVIDCADGIRYKSRPELTRNYSIPMRAFKRIVKRAASKDLDIVPKLNFARSALHDHNKWFMPHTRMFDTGEYWRLAFELIDELIDVCRPANFFHIGMDEDHQRSHRQFHEAINVLHEGLKERGLRTVMWKDCQTWPEGEVHCEKSLASEDHISTDVVQVPWDYGKSRGDVIRQLRDKGFEVWGAPGKDTEQTRQWREDLLSSGGTGLLMTNWIPCRPGNRRELLSLIREAGPVYSGG